MLQVSNVSYKIRNKVLLHPISASFAPNQLHLIIGPNGAGKSTFIKLLSSQLSPLTGTIYWEGQDIQLLSKFQMAKARAVLSQDSHLSFPLKAWEIVMMGRYPHYAGQPGIKDETVCLEAMRYFNVQELAGRNYETLSGGEQQRVHFARIMAQVWEIHENKKCFLLLDEPLTFLDVHYQHTFMNQLVSLTRETPLTIIGVVHDLNLAARFADKLYLLNNGHLIAHGTTAQVMTKQNIEAAYQLKTEIAMFNERLVILF